jgi:hypothetical protein
MPITFVFQCSELVCSTALGETNDQKSINGVCLIKFKLVNLFPQNVTHFAPNFNLYQILGAQKAKPRTKGQFLNCIDQSQGMHTAKIEFIELNFKSLFSIYQL